MPSASPFSIRSSILLKSGRPVVLAVLLSQTNSKISKFWFLANSLSSAICASIERICLSFSSVDFLQYPMYLIMYFCYCLSVTPRPAGLKNFCLLICFPFLRPTPAIFIQFGLFYAPFYMWQSPPCHISVRKIHVCDLLRTNSNSISRLELGLPAHRFAVRLARPRGARLTKCLPNLSFVLLFSNQKAKIFKVLCVL